jgi:diaminopimelate epimerase
MLAIPFTKAQGAGNDFLILEGAPEATLPSPQDKRRICDRRFGVGADGIVFLSAGSPASGIDADLRLFNSDGGEAEISGNGTRCAAAYLFDKGSTSNPLHIRTAAGIKPLRLVSRQGQHFEFEMAMGAPILDPRAIAFSPPAPVANAPMVDFLLPLSTGSRTVTVTSMGNPHCSMSVDDFDWDWQGCGQEIETHSYFPQRTNVEFYRALHLHEIQVRFWERGVGVTLSSGTGSCAAAVAAILNRQAQSPVTVRTAGGNLSVRWEADGVYLTGPAVIICRGEYLLA